MTAYILAFTAGGMIGLMLVLRNLPKVYLNARRLGLV